MLRSAGCVVGAAACSRKYSTIESTSVECMFCTARALGPFCYAGTSVEGLTRLLLNGKAKTENLTPLVAVRFSSGPLYIVCGNRRTRALQDYAAELTKQSRELAFLAFPCLS